MVLAFNVGPATGVPSAKQALFDAVNMIDLAPRQTVFSVGVPGSLFLTVDQASPNMETSIGVELLDFFSRFSGFENPSPVLYVVL